MKTLTITGNIGKIDTKFTDTGKQVTEFSIAVNSKEKGEKVTEWFKCVAWEKTAEIISQFATVGSKMLVSGSPKLETWNSKDSGEAKGQIVVTVREFEFLGGGKKEADDTNPY